MLEISEMDDPRWELALAECSFTSTIIGKYGSELDPVASTPCRIDCVKVR